MAVMPFDNPDTRIDVPAPTRTSVERGPKQRRPIYRLALLVASLLVIAAGAGYVAWRILLQPVTVQVASTGGDLKLKVFGLGTVGARVRSNVGFKVAGILIDLRADQGDRVHADAVLARLDARDVAAQLASAKAGVSQAAANIAKANADVESARANLVNAQAVNARRSVLARSGFASKEEAQTADAAMRVARANLDVAASESGVARAALESAQAQQEFAQVTLDNDTLRAPYDALVVSRNLELGSMPTPGQAVFTLVDPRTIWILSYVDERLAGRLRPGQPAEIVLRSQPGERLPGHVARIEIQSDSVNEERLVEVAFDRIPPDIHLAEQAEVFITTGVLADAVAVAPTAVTGLTDGGGTVWTLENGRLARRHVSFGPELLDGRLPVASGLPDGARVVLAPLAGLRVGRAAKVATGTAP